MAACNRTVSLQLALGGLTLPSPKDFGLFGGPAGGWQGLEAVVSALSSPVPV